MLNPYRADILDAIEEYFAQRADTRDGSDGPQPNDEMSLLTDFRNWRASHPEALTRLADAMICGEDSPEILKLARQYSSLPQP